jgi:thiaminase
MLYTDSLCSSVSLTQATEKPLFQESAVSMDQFRHFVIQNMAIHDTWKRLLAVLISKFPLKHNMAGGRNAQQFLAEMIADQSKEVFYSRAMKELKISKDETEDVSLVTQAVCDYLTALVYNKNYKDGLLAIFCAGYVGCGIQKKGTQMAPMVQEWMTIHQNWVSKVTEWAKLAINEIRENDQINMKHVDIMRYSYMFEQAFWASINNPVKYQWITNPGMKQ